MSIDNHFKIEQLIKRGVNIPNPESIDIGNEVDLERISGNGVTLYAGCKIYGASTLILKGCQLGYEGPVTLDDCQLGADVNLKSGYFSKAVFMEKAGAGAGAHVREGTILEEQASIAHTVGLKQTILFPFVTLGSLINFCDCLMTGGTSRKDHSEVGSSYIHFNYTPNQDKATASLLGDVPSGVMLNQRPIFLGGQGGLVGPCRLAFGTVIAAGSIYRKDEHQPDRLLIGAAGRGGSMPYNFGMYQNIKRIVINNFVYIANLFALKQWYDHVRARFISPERFPVALLFSLQEKLDMGINERIKRLGALAERMPEAIETYKEAAGDKASEKIISQKQALHDQWERLLKVMENQMHSEFEVGRRKRFLKYIERGIEQCGRDYISVIQTLPPEDSAAGTEWLQKIVDGFLDDISALLPEFGNIS